MKNSIVVQIAEGLGNQLFMYAHAYSMAKKLNYELFIDNKSGYSFKKKHFTKTSKIYVRLIKYCSKLCSK